MPENVTSVSENPPDKFLAWFMGPMPKAEMVYRLSHYGSLNENYIDGVPELIAKWEQNEGKE
jgi:hypothetical protein